MEEAHTHPAAFLIQRSRGKDERRISALWLSDHSTFRANGHSFMTVGRRPGVMHVCVCVCVCV